MSSDILTRIKICLNDCRRQLNGRNSVVDRSIQNALERLEQPMQLAIIGRLSSSKSTLVNALLGNPDVAKTDKSEETYNVSWIRYGEDEHEITVVFRNGKKIKAKRSDLADWTSRHGKKALSSGISHIEIPIRNELLKSVNIIDTPGLDSAYGSDSQNTISFLENVKPDAVVMLFTKSINSETLETLTEFQRHFCAGSYNITPMNAIGVMGKVDELWKVIDSRNTPLMRGQKVIDSLFSSNPDLSKIFQNIYPVSALLGLGSCILDERDLLSLKSLSCLTGKLQIATFADVKFFVKEIKEVRLSEVSRRILLDKLGLYGVYEAVAFLQKNPDADLDKVRSHLEEVSGISKILLAVITHFGKRAIILKTRNSLTSVLYTIGVEKSKESEVDCIEIYNSLTDELTTTLFSIREYELWDILSKVYEGRICIEDLDAIADLKNIAGENGVSASNKLGLCSTISVEDMAALAKSKSKQWASRYTLAKMRNKRDAGNIYRVMSAAYGELEHEIISARDEIQKAERTIRYNNDYLFNI